MYKGTDIRIEPAPGKRDVRLDFCATPFGGVTLNTIAFPDGVHANAPLLQETVDFCVHLEGSAQMTIGGTTIENHKNTGVVLSPNNSFDVLSVAGYLNLNVSVPRLNLESQLRSLTGRDNVDSLQFDAAIDFTNNKAMADLWRMVDFAVSELERESSSVSNPLVREEFAESLLTGILYAQPHNFSHLLSRRFSGPEPKYVRQVEEYIRAHCHQPVKAQNLSALTGISMSALYAGFRRHRGYSPMQFLKRVRLDRIRSELLIGSPETTIKDVASRWGFTHLGRFSAAYAKRFGELPSVTLSRATT